MAAGLARVPLRPMNSVRSAVKVRSAKPQCTKATRSAKSALNGHEANRAPVLGSRRVTTCMAVLSRNSPSTHSQYPLTDSRNVSVLTLRSVRAMNFTGASAAT